MSINAYEQMATGVSDIASITLVTFEVIHNAMLINELRPYIIPLCEVICI